MTRSRRSHWGHSCGAALCSLWACMVCMRRGQQCHRAPSAFQLVSFIGVPDGRPRFVCAVCSCRVIARRVFGWCGLRAERVPVCVGEAVRCSLEIRRALVWVLPLSAAVLARPCCVRPRTPSPGGRGGSGISILAAPSALYSRPPVSPYPCGSLMHTAYVILACIHCLYTRTNRHGGAHP